MVSPSAFRQKGHCCFCFQGGWVPFLIFLPLPPGPCPRDAALGAAAGFLSVVALAAWRPGPFSTTPGGGEKGCWREKGCLLTPRPPLYKNGPGGAAVTRPSPPSPRPFRCASVASRTPKRSQPTFTFESVLHFALCLISAHFLTLPAN